MLRLIPVVELEDLSLVPIGDLDDSGLRRLVDKALEDLDAEDALPIEEQLAALDGGLRVSHDGVVLVEPACCCGLDSIEEWRRALARPDWRDVWVGHDRHRLELRARDRGHQVRWGAWGQAAWDGVVEVPAGDLERELQEATAALARLAARIDGLLPPALGDRRPAVARILAGAADPVEADPTTL